jgi:23S rRNA (guanosine2251-2'-O)-methyltransferase
MSQQQHIYGFHTILARLKRHPQTLREIYLDEARRDARVRELMSVAESLRVRVMPVSSQRLDGMVPGARHQGVVAHADPLPLHRDLFELLDGLQEIPLLLVLDGVQDPHNLGACLRVADAAGAHAVIAPKDRAVGLTATASKVASGAAETVPYFTVTNLARTLRELKEHGVWLAGADSEATQDLYSADLRGPLAWVMGAEGAGLRRLTRESCDLLLRIPLAGAVESLNVSVASGICLFETRRQRLVASSSAAAKTK